MPELVGGLRQLLWDRGEWRSTVVPGKEERGRQVLRLLQRQRAAEERPVAPRPRAAARPQGRLPAPRRRAAGRGRRGRPDASPSGASPAGPASSRRAAPPTRWLAETVRWTWKVKLPRTSRSTVEQRLREQAEAEAIRVFGRNLHDLLLAAPAGQRMTMGLDPGHPHRRQGRGRRRHRQAARHRDGLPARAAQRLGGHAAHAGGASATRHGVQLISIGNGTASRETDKLAGDLIARHPELSLTKVVVSEAGASVYSASELAAKEFPDLDVSLRGAVSIARRLQDPLAELVRIDPKAIGVGQYQHDVNQAQLARKLDAVVEDCVNAVGADVNTASAPLLARISGLSETLAKNIVAFRDEHGAFRNRKQLLKVPRVGERTFQQAAGFLRIMNGDNPLDASAVHPEAYPVVERIVARTGVAGRAS